VKTKTFKKTLKLKGFLTREESMRLLRKKSPDTYAYLKRPSLRACIAWNVLDRRAKLGFSQSELAEKAGISRRAAQYIEDLNSSVSPSLDALEKVAKALKLEVTDLFKNVDMTKQV
jgi:DNA-binding XRE family transcriptional regulator